MNFYNIDYAYMVEVFPRILRTAPLTLGLAFSAMILGLIIATCLALTRVFKIRVLSTLTRVYISFFRGTPLLVQLFMLYYGVPQIIPSLAKMNAMTAAILGLSLHSAAYMAEIIRGAISSVEKGQMEACLSVGMTPMQAMRRVILPQATRVAVPSLANSFISLIKESSLAFTLGVAEMMAQARMSSAATYKFFENFLVALLIYWGISITIGFLQDRIEIKLNKAY
ncbi:amino acid ABC transporter permease [Alkaliphilus transvaalensis]|uniref:amino acid ABC transporter permease n=1 Tax=Alkaliphilus transvaalensis TaxID=114628 RepID=UPI00054EC43C|nr:amino acid ABC transporter permease [Alkaliphilus transvaalensis]